MTDPAATLPSNWRRGVKPTDDGIYLDVPREAYERVDRTNWSKLKHLKRSPAHFRAAMLEREPEDTDALRIGRATHVATLEPDRFLSSFAVWDGDRRAGKEWEKFKEKNAGLEILKYEQYELVKALSEAARTNEHAAPYLRGGAAEVTMLWTHRVPDNGVKGYSLQCKGRLDFAPGAEALVDLKTCRDASPEAFARAAWNLDYLGQAAYYVDGYAAASNTPPRPYVIVAVEKEAPHVVQVYRVPEELLDQGRQLYRDLLDRLHHCRSEGRWPGYADGPLDLQLPSWMRAETDVSGLGLEFEGEVAA